MKTYINKLFLVASVILISSCYKLELPPETYELPESRAFDKTQNIEFILNGLYNSIGSMYIGSGATAGEAMLMSDVMDKNIFTSKTLLGGTGGSSFLQYANFNSVADPATNARMYNVFRSAYLSITGATDIITFIEKGETPDNAYPAQKDRLKGEAYFVRAFCNFNLLRLTGHQYSSATQSQLGVIDMRTPFSLPHCRGRLTVKESYDWIIEDLNNAVLLIPDKFDPVVHAQFPNFQYRGIKGAARALLAKVYFQKLDYANASLILKDVIGSTAGTVANFNFTGTADVKAAFSTAGTTKFPSEVIFGFYASTTDTRISGIHNDLRTFVSGAGTATQAHVGIDSTNLLKYFPLTDKRRTDLLLLNGTATNPNFSTIKSFAVSRKYSLIPQSGGMNVPIIRSPELVLMRAEINAINNNLADAITDLNLVRTRAGAPVYSNVLPVKDDVLNAILIERYKELLFEGENFWSWKRVNAFNVEIPNSYPTTLLAHDRNPAITWDSPKTLTKIPQREIDNNGCLVGQQNQ